MGLSDPSRSVPQVQDLSLGVVEVVDEDVEVQLLGRLT